MIWPPGSVMKELPQKVRSFSVPTRLMAATKRPLAMACERWMICQDSRWRWFSSSASSLCQAMAVGYRRSSAPCRAESRAASGNH